MIPMIQVASRTQIGLLVFCMTLVGQAQAAERLELDNGIKVLFEPIPGVGQIAIESVYEVGFVHEPMGAPQWAHLLEHVVCFGATDRHDQREIMDSINQIGMANAETLAYWTHYDYLVPKNRLEWVFEAEAARLSSLQFDQSLIDHEAPRCHAEAAIVEGNPQVPMLKFAMMALVQGWRYEQGTAWVHRGLENATVDSLKRFYQQTYRPDRLTLVVVGDFDVQEAKRFVSKHLSGALAHDQPAVEDPSWDDLPSQLTVEWDSKRRAICVAYPPPADVRSQWVLTMWGSLLSQRLTADDALKPLTAHIFSNVPGWTVGPMPLFVYAEAKPDVDIEELERVLVNKIDALRTEPLRAREIAQINAIIGALSESPPLTKESVAQQAGFLKAQQNINEAKATQMVLAHSAIQRAIYAGLPKFPRRLTPQVVNRIVSDAMASDKRTVSRLVPQAINSEPAVD